MAINPLEINDPMIYFRLDPGEPGVRTSAMALAFKGGMGSLDR